MTIKETASLLKKLSNARRLVILVLISKSKGLEVRDLVETLDIPQDEISHHLKILLGIGLIQYVKNLSDERIHIYHLGNRVLFGRIKSLLDYIAVKS